MSSNNFVWHSVSYLKLSFGTVYVRVGLHVPSTNGERIHPQQGRTLPHSKSEWESVLILRCARTETARTAELRVNYAGGFWTLHARICRLEILRKSPVPDIVGSQ